MFEAANTEEQAALNAPEGTALAEAVEELRNHTSDIVDEIEALPARTLAGLYVKVRAIRWCFSWDPITAEELYCGDGSPTTDLRLVVSILNDVEAVGDGRRATA